MPTSQSIFIVIHSWQVVRQQRLEHKVIELAMERLVQIEPRAAEELPQDVASGIIHFLEFALDNMGPDDDVMRENIMELIERHMWGHHNLKPEFIPHMKAAFLWALSQELESTWSVNTENAWTKFCNYIILDILPPCLCVDISIQNANKGDKTPVKPRRRPSLGDLETARKTAPRRKTVRREERSSSLLKDLMSVESKNRPFTRSISSRFLAKATRRTTNSNPTHTRNCRY